MTVVISSSRLWNDGFTPANNTTRFREFISSWTGMLSQSGWVNTNASGSVDPTTVNAPASSNTYPGYQVWRFDDNLHHNGYPVYVKVEYGVETEYRNPSIVVSSGFWHNGSGSICPGGLGIGCTPRIGSAIRGFGLINNAIQYTHKLCCISGSDLVAFVADSTTGSFTATVMFSVERIKDTNGNSTTNGVVVQTTSRGGTDASPNDNFRQTYFEYGPNSASQTPPTETIPNYIIAGASGIYNNDLTIGMLIPVLSASFGYPSRMAGFVQSGVLTPGTTHQLTLFNTSSTYYVSDNLSAQTAAIHGRSASATNSYRYIIRYE
jgi:hypothetical protein